MMNAGLKGLLGTGVVKILGDGGACCQCRRDNLDGYVFVGIKN